MPNLLIRDISEETHRELVRRAAARGQSLQQYLAAELTRIAAAPTLEDVLTRIETRSGGRVGLAQAVDDLAAERRADLPAG
jgi:plasmid stability protein